MSARTISPCCNILLDRVATVWSSQHCSISPFCDVTPSPWLADQTLLDCFQGYFYAPLEAQNYWEFTSFLVTKVRKMKTPNSVDFCLIIIDLLLVRTVDGNPLV